MSLLDSNPCCLEMVLQGKQIWDHKLERKVASPCVSAASESLCPPKTHPAASMCRNETKYVVSLSLRGLSTHWMSQPHSVFYCPRIFRYSQGTKWNNVTTHLTEIIPRHLKYIDKHKLPRETWLLGLVPSESCMT